MCCRIQAQHSADSEKKKRSRFSKSSTLGNFFISPTWSTNTRLGAKQEQLLCGSTGTSSGIRPETKLAWFGHITRHDSLSKTILQDTFEGGRRRGRQRKCWMDNIKEWASLPMAELLTRAPCGKDRKSHNISHFLIIASGDKCFPSE